MLASLARYLLPTAGAIGLLLAGMLWVQTQRLESTQRQLVETREQLEIAKRSIVQLELDAAEVERRHAIEQDAREDIIRMPEPDRKKPLAPIWRRAFRAADELGGVE
jgi:hypothetical protein